ncbi:MULTISPECIES: UDP-N-acetylmuramoyl-tripeptide--D-alanyl-D-alanine ligase [unclassified Faecalibacterium]|uniref:UDP-N-acetylmuramoyl-tripeptide--D-alanyl-D- alanine ligase n=1 Tax=unclassified Faecalibacterium TaxID=2646395 RepID=UPI000B3A20BA|nr:MULTISPECIES: UDP-N-acetylmuramoyl-tripeptide--D-alanyl-D-alanine ligase [unclassified Faecalibacterium]OUN74134.1 UDP-N-acetylmuramoyl-tripeptide--D-alanyl-D-alanine ligase [Faecalibacterium sp. An58]OUQ40665.1 UDP-N-acetylmuramoyl-tripeptide--D-alanyl-D-alanine ligase [Faecalibacterium sp. An121]
MEHIAAKTLLAGLVPAQRLADGQDITLVTTDSREVISGCVFVAFPGEHFDGHDFAARALEAGAAWVVLNHPVEGVPEEKTILCPDSYQAMMQMGANYRAQFAPKVVGVTGSVGKTTTKEFCAVALSGLGQTIKTEGNQNNELGLPRTLFQIDGSTQYAVIEMGMNHAGEISRLSRCARPDVGVITCIGLSHIGNLGSQENICKAKLEICDGMPEGAPLVLNYDDPFLRKAELPAHVRPVWYSMTSQEADVYASAIRQENDGMSFLLDDAENGCFMVHIPALGRHNVANALAAYCAASQLGLTPKEAIRLMKEFRQTGMRQQMMDSHGVRIIQDCYNANPNSMQAALEMFKEYPCKRRFAVLADMLELGDQARAAHEELGRLVARSNIDLLMTYGELARRTATVAAAKGVRTIHANNYEEIAGFLAKAAQPGDAVLFKGSRAMALENAVERMKELQDAAAAAQDGPKENGD